MKNLTACTLSVLLTLFLTACGQSDKTSVDNASSEKVIATQAATTNIGTNTEQNMSPSLPTVLVNNDWLIKYSDLENLHILELGRTQEEFNSGHIPGAKFVDWRNDISDPDLPELYNVLPRGQFETLMSDLGITPESIIVLYDSMLSRAATRMYWTLKYYGHSNIKILDGGLSIWQNADLELASITADQQAPAIVKTTYKVTKIETLFLEKIDYLVANLSNDNLTVVDGRPFDQYTGDKPGKVVTTGKEHIRDGHIYGAQSVPWADNLRPDGTFKSPAELTEIYAHHDIVNSGTVVTYCNEGLHAAMPWFVLHELLGFSDVRLYDSSMGEWANTFDTAMIKGEHCM